MKNLQIKTNPEVESVFARYPDGIREKIWNLRRLIVEVAAESDEIEHLEETLKWGEPSYLVAKGSTLRIDWKKNKPDQYAMYFKCTSKLVTTFKEIYRDTFKYEGNRAIVFQLKDSIPEEELKNCISVCLRYHKVKALPHLGLH